MPPLNLFKKSCISLVLGQLVVMTGAEAARITVNSDEDFLNTDLGGTCTLRKALESINQQTTKPGCINTGDAFGNDDTIEFEPTLSTSTITLAGEELVINGDSTTVNTTLQGSNVTINPDGKSRGFRVASENTLVLNHLTVSNGSRGVGGAIYLEASAGLIANNATFTNNVAAFEGGAIAVFNSDEVESRATVTLKNSTISGNSADAGAGVFISGGNANITDSKISNNTLSSASGGGGLNLQQGRFVLNRVTINSNQQLTDNSTNGGGVSFSSRGEASLEIISSTISNNVVNNKGGGLSLYLARGDSATIVNSTISSNFAGRQNDNNPNSPLGSGAGIYLRGQGTLVLQNTTVFNNSLALSSNGSTSARGAGVNVTDSSMQLVNSVIGGAIGGFDCNEREGATVTADQFNIIQDGSCETSAQAGNPQLMPLANNGGATKTHLPRDVSAAINGGDNLNCQTRDQRGEIRARSNTDRCDIGAVEVVEEGGLFVVPTKNGKVVVFEL